MSEGTSLTATVAVIIVGFHNAADIVDCLSALANAEPEPRFEIFIAENGGRDATNMLLAALAPFCRPITGPDRPADSLFQLSGRQEIRVHVAAMPENLGYAGAINVWLRRLLLVPGWDAAWILNPDTEPTPSALRELVEYAEHEHKAMVGSCIVRTATPQLVHMRGIAWRKLIAKALAVDQLAEVAVTPDAADVEARIDAPSGASIYVTRALIQRIGLPDERYFLYFEDMDWGFRAQTSGGVGYAHRSVVWHKCATTIGRTSGRTASPLAVYLTIRNAIIFVRRHFPLWLPWTIVMQFVHVSRLARHGRLSPVRAGYRGILAGIRGEVGRPDHMFGSQKRQTYSPRPFSASSRRAFSFLARSSRMPRKM